MEQVKWDRKHEPFSCRCICLFRSPMDKRDLAYYTGAYLPLPTLAFAGVNHIGFPSKHWALPPAAAALLVIIIIIYSTNKWTKYILDSVIFNHHELEKQAEYSMNEKIDKLVQSELNLEPWPILDEEGNPSQNKSIRQIALELKYEFGPIAILQKHGVELDPKSEDTKITDQLSRWIDEMDGRMPLLYQQALEFETRERVAEEEREADEKEKARYSEYPRFTGIKSEQEAIEYLSNDPNWDVLSLHTRVEGFTADAIASNTISGELFVVEIKAGDYERALHRVENQFMAADIEFSGGYAVYENTNIFFGKPPERWNLNRPPQTHFSDA